jgi:hypothetical protein
MRSLYALVVLSSLFLSSCRFFGGERINGDGNVVTRSKEVGAFHSIDVSGAMAVRVRQGAAGVQIQADQNLIEYVDVFTEGNTLVIKTRRGYNLRPSRDMVVLVSAPEYQNIDLSGASNVTGEGVLSGNRELFIKASGASEISLQVDLPKLGVDVSGSTSVVLRGQARDFHAEASGASSLKCFDLRTEVARVDLSGASDADVDVSKELTVDASGASNVSYRGNPRISQKVSGAGSVARVD